jgi:hypothetical protein
MNLSPLRLHELHPKKSCPLFLPSIAIKFVLSYKYHLTNNHVSYLNHSVWVIIAINSFNIRYCFHQSLVLESISSLEQKGNLANCC